MLFTHPPKPLNEYSSKELTMFILDIVAAGVLIVGIAVAPGIGIVFKQLDNLHRKERNRFVRKVRLMERAGYIKKEKTRYSVTEKGGRRISEYEVWNEAPKIPAYWDGKWHMILFDIPVKKTRQRQLLHARLRELGCIRYQDSVFVHKHDLRKSVEMFTEFYNLRTHMRFAEVASLEGSREVEKQFATHAGQLLHKK